MADLDANPALEDEIEADLYLIGDLRAAQSAGVMSFFIEAKDRIQNGHMLNDGPYSKQVVANQIAQFTGTWEGVPDGTVIWPYWGEPTDAFHFENTGNGLMSNGSFSFAIPSSAVGSAGRSVDLYLKRMDSESFGCAGEIDVISDNG